MQASFLWPINEELIILKFTNGSANGVGEVVQINLMKEILVSIRVRPQIREEMRVE
jgi:hypothetical protein